MSKSLNPNSIRAIVLANCRELRPDEPIHNLVNELHAKVAEIRGVPPEQIHRGTVHAEVNYWQRLQRRKAMTAKARKALEIKRKTRLTKPMDEPQLAATTTNLAEMGNMICKLQDMEKILSLLITNAINDLDHAIRELRTHD